MTIGENIKARRTQLRMSQEYVADQLGISRQAVAKWEAGKSEPSPANLMELSALLELSMEELTDPRGYFDVRLENECQEKEIVRKEQERKRNAKFLLGRKHKLTSLQILVGGVLLFSIFYGKRLFNFLPYGLNLVLGDAVIIVCLCVLNLKYWRHIWDCRRTE